MNIQEYISNISALYNTGRSTEHSYRGDLQQLLQTMLLDVDITNEPKRIDCGAPDYILSRKGKDIPIGYIEAKDIGVELGAKIHKEQFDRYRAALNNLIITDYLQFHFYKDGQLTQSVFIGEIGNGKIHPLPQQFDKFTALIQNFALTITQSIKSPTKLASMMAAKAKLMAQVIKSALDEDDAREANSELQAQRQAFKTILIHDIDNAQFADIYAQTIAYGLFAARYHDPTLPTFSREEAATLIPKSNPFLRRLFQTVATYSLDDNVGERLLWIVEELVQVFLATDVAKIMQGFGKSTRQHDPVVHFYETFLAEYDPKLRKARGVWYTPEPVVNFIVRAVDDILKTKFSLPQGLADTSKTKVKIKTDKPDKRTNSGYVELEKEFHNVQILDPATGTGTFLAKTVEHIYQNNFASMQGMWPAYVKEHLIPRLNGFELLMTSYAMAHLKLDMLLTETGYKADDSSERFNIYLTNSLEEHHPDTGTLFASWLSSEANEANRIKRDAPVMVVMGNPPYSGESANKGDWIMGLMEDYKKEPGGKVKLQERNPKWINDDYVKFMRFGQHFIDKNGEGVLAFINPHGFLDNPTFRGMRWSLLNTYDEIYVLDLHGNSKKKETAPDGSADINVFDIMQGVSVNFFVKTGRKKSNELAQVYHCDLYGKREAKYDFLVNNSIKTVPYVKIDNVAPSYYFVQKDFGAQKVYQDGFALDVLFPVNSVGAVTSWDSFVIDSNKDDLRNRIEEFFRLTPKEVVSKFSLKENRIDEIKAIQAKEVSFKSESLTKIIYRPFDYQFIYYNSYFIGRSRFAVMKHILGKDNLALIFSRTVVGSYDWCDIQVSDSIVEFGVMATRVGNGAPLAPLYTYPDSTDLLAETTRTPNLNMQIVNEIAQGLGLTFTPEKITTVIPAKAGIQVDLKQNQKMDSRLRGNDGVETSHNSTFAPIDLLDYIYAVLHSPSYRETYKEFLKIDFPRVPYPKNAQTFWQLVALGGELRNTHLLENAPATSNVSYPVAGDNVVDKLRYEASKVFINATQYFENVPEIAWNFYIGGYQPAQKWLKDRKGRALNFEDIQHYQKIINALIQTHRIMAEVDRINRV